MPEWHCTAIVYRPFAKVAPGIQNALQQNRIDYVDIQDETTALDNVVPPNVTALLLGIVSDSFALKLFTWAKQTGKPVIAIEEVAQLALNEGSTNNYDAPFDRLFLASHEEKRLFLQLAFPPETLRVSGLLANDRLRIKDTFCEKDIRERLAIRDEKKPIIYSTSPVRNRLGLHNKDDWSFREEVLRQIAIASRRCERKIVIKLHPNEDLKTERSRINEIIPDAIVLGRETNMDELFSVAGVLVNRGNSQTCLEAVLRGIPTVVAACGLKTLFHDDGGAYIVNELDKLSDTIETAANEGPIDAFRVREKHFFAPPEGVARYIAKEITALASKPLPATENTWNLLLKTTLFVGRHDQALQLCEKLASLTSWQETVYRALKSHLEKRSDAAIAAWRECLALDQNWFFPHYELAHGYQASGEYPLAIEHAQRAIELHPPHHTLWHEIPMRVVIMASHRRLGDVARAAAELKLMDNRGLVEIVPELLIEKAAQISVNDQLDEAVTCLDNARRQIVDYPVSKATDLYLLERAGFQYLEVAERFAATSDRARSLTCLEQTARIASQIQPVMEAVVSQSLKLGELWESDKNLCVAEKCYILAAETDSGDHWSRYGLARIALKQGRIFKAIAALRLLIETPDGPKRVLAEILSPGATARASRFWPVTPKSILRPIKLSTYMLAWAIQRTVKSGFHDFFEATTTLLMVWMFVARHFYRRLSSDSARVANVLPSRLFRKSPSTYHVTSCPICGSPGKFEHQNKLTPLFRCHQCNHVYARDLPDDTALSTLYGDFGYWEKDRCHQGITSIQENQGWETYLNARMGILERLQLLECPSTRARSVFEIGCAEGMLLHALGKRGIAASGCEMNHAVAQEGMRQLGVQILTDPFEKLELPHNHFDLVMSFHTLEHMRFPVEIFAKAAHIIRPDGAILIEVPCGEEEYENTDHLHFFCESSLRLLLDKFFVTSEILDNSYTNSAGIRIGSIYGFGRGVRSTSAQHGKHSDSPTN
jgi:tetratricopeptide (TPR) repeat protein/SAM-dependent methyltransferase